jgi:hypothetical protein
MPGHWGGSSSSSGPGPGGQGARGQATQGGGGGGGGPPGQGGGGQAAQRQRAAEQAAAQRAVQQAAVDKAAVDKARTERAMQQQIAQAEAQQAAQKTATAGLRGDDPDLDKKAWDKIYQKQNEYLKTVDANTVSQLELDKIANDTLHQMYLGTGTPATQDYQNIFQTGAIQQTPGDAYQPPVPAGTGEGLGSINPFEQPGARTAIPKAPVINPFEQPGARTAIPKALVPAGTGEGLGSIDVGFQNALRKQQIRKDEIAAQQDPNYGQFFRPQPVVEKPKFFDTGMGKFVKGAGVALMPTLASAFLPKQAVTALTWAKRLKDIKEGKGILGLGAKKLGLTGNLKSNIKRPTFRDERTTLGKQDIEAWERKQDWSGIKPDVGGGGDGQGQGQAPANVIQASIQKFSPDEMNMIKQRHSQLQEVINSGIYQGRQLTAEEIQMLQQKALDIQKLMEQYLVDPTDLARGGIARLYG